MGGAALQHASEKLKNDRGVVLAADKLWHDREFTLAAVRMHGSYLVRAPERLRKDREVVLAAVRNDPSALQYAYPTLHYEPEIQMVCRAGGGGSDGNIASLFRGRTSGTR